jgi:hypothetical protein
MLAIIFCHHASIGGIPCGSDEEVFETGVVLKKSNDNSSFAFSGLSCGLRIKKPGRMPTSLPPPLIAPKFALSFAGNDD